MKLTSLIRFLKVPNDSDDRIDVYSTNLINEILSLVLKFKCNTIFCTDRCSVR